MSYVHGYDRRANVRLQDQADALVDLLHSDTHYPEGTLVLEAGCGVGAQTITLVRNSPHARFVSIDISPDSLAAAQRKVQSANVRFQQADVYQLPFARESFDHVFVCFLLEHLARPLDALEKLKQVLKPGGSITVIEGDHGSTYFHPDSTAAHDAIRCQVELQRASGGNANIGRELYPLLRQARFADVSVSPRMVYVDASRPRFVDGFTRRTFTAMIEGVREAAVRAGMITAARFDEGIRALYRTAEEDGVFCYTFFKALGRKL
jgi:SAM-dependent methyltransferase